MTRYWMRPATLEDIDPLVMRVRPEDVSELWAAAMATPERALRDGILLSPESWVGMADDLPLCIFGVAPVSLLGRVGAPWMVGTSDIDRHAFGFLKACKGAVAEMIAPYPYLFNFVDARNDKAVRWLKWLGFTMPPAEPYGPFGLPFHRFEMKRDVHV